MSANFDSYSVFVPGTCEGITWGYERVEVLALDEADAIEKACAEWYGTGAREGTYLVVASEHLNAYEVEERRVPNIMAEVSLPRAAQNTGTKEGV